MNYYNEFNPKCAAALRQLMADGLIPKGYIDDRSITEVTAADLRGFTQCHFFAGIGGWSLALELAGWPSTRPVWTGSAPCQPYSAAGKSARQSDERHLWPYQDRLIGECRPSTFFGEQVASAIAAGWIDDVFDGLETKGYACAAAVLPACGVGAPHIRERLWFVADRSESGDNVANAERGLCEGRPELTLGRSERGIAFDRPGEACTVADPKHNGQHAAEVARGDAKDDERGRCARRPDGSEQSERGRFAGNVPASALGNADGSRSSPWISTSPCGGEGLSKILDYTSDRIARPWQSGQWIDCADGKKRLIEPCIRLLADGFSERVALIGSGGNAIVPQLAAEFIGAFMDTQG